MTIEVKEKGSKEFYKEVVNVISQYKQLMKKPEAKLNDNFKSYTIMMVAMAVIFATQVLRGMFDGVDALGSAALTASFMAFLVLFLYRSNMKKMVDAYLKDGRASTITLDENGVELNKGGSQVMRVGWDGIAFVRSFRESTCFLSKDVMGLVIAVTNTHKDEIVNYLKENDIKVKIL